jgi:hypothetical protein
MKRPSVKNSGFAIPNHTSIAVTIESITSTHQIFVIFDLNYKSPLKISNLRTCAIACMLIGNF